MYRSIFTYILFLCVALLISCHDTGPDPIDGPDPMDTMKMDTMPMDTLILRDVIIGDYEGTCFHYKADWFQGVTTYSRDTLYNVSMNVTIDTSSTGDVHINVLKSGHFYPYNFFATKEEYESDTMQLNGNISVYWTDITIVRSDTTISTDFLMRNLNSPAFLICKCNFHKK